MPKKFYRKRKRRLTCRKRKVCYNTKPELEFKAILEKLEIEYEQQFRIQNKYYDFYLPDYNALIEVDGIYWHGIGVEFEQKSRMQKRTYKNDLYKDGLAAINGFIIKRINEGEITVSKVKKLLKECKNI